MFENKLKLNPGKNEFIVLGSMGKYKWFEDSFPVNILANCLSPRDVVRNRVYCWTLNSVSPIMQILSLNLALKFALYLTLSLI